MPTILGVIFGGEIFGGLKPWRNKAEKLADKSHLKFKSY